MKMMKALKRLKLWSRRKKQYRLLQKESPPPPLRPPPPPPPPYYPHHLRYEAFLPSAPPIPPWLEHDLLLEEMPSTSEVSLDSSITKPDFPPPEPEADASHYEGSNMNEVTQERDVGCVVKFAVDLLRSLFPCFHIPEAPNLRQTQNFNPNSTVILL